MSDKIRPYDLIAGITGQGDVLPLVRSQFERGLPPSTDPSPECPVLYRALELGGVELRLFLPVALCVEDLRQLAKCSDIRRLLEAGLDALSVSSGSSPKVMDSASRKVSTDK